MRPQDASGTDDLLLRDLLAGLSRPGPAPTLSVGMVGSAGHAPQPPAHCLRSCLDGDAAAVATRGCAFLQAAARNDAGAAAPPDGRCPRGFQVAAQSTQLGGAALTLVTVEGPLGDGPEPGGHDGLLAHLDAASRVVQRVGQMLEENSGFANEVIQNYEQLNLIFDLTRQIAQVTEPRQIETLLLQRIARLLHTPAVALVTHGDAWRGCADEAGVAALAGPASPLAPRDVDELLAFVRSARQVYVSPLTSQQVIAGPLVRLDDRVDVVIAVRPGEDAPFNAGDMMLVESVLTFGGQIISNSELHTRLRKMLLEVTRALVAAIDKKDHYTSGHSERGGFLTRLTAAELGLPPAEQQIMEWAGLLHDVGKIGIPEEILCKPGKLTVEEYEIIKSHPRMGYEILKPIESFELVLDGVLYHHEHPDGSGYPEGRKGAEIPLVARIIHVADTFDALTSTRSYRKAFPLEKALEIIRGEMGTRIDVEAAEAFFRALERYRREQPDDFRQRFPAFAASEDIHDS